MARQPGGRSKGWGLVDYESPDAANNAIATLHNSELQGRSIIVRLERAGGANKSGGPNAGRPEASSGLQIVVRNLPWSTTSEDLRQVFQQVGTVIKAEAVCHADTGRSKGWGTVLFETREQAQAAIQGFNGVELEHRPMQIKLDRYDWSDEDLAGKIEACLTDSAMAARLAATSAHMQSAGGTATAAKLLDDLVREHA